LSSKFEAGMIKLRNHILQQYQVTPDDRLGSGMEAEVYAYGADQVLKLYFGTVNLADLQTLKDFYESLDRRGLPYALPYIHTIEQIDSALVTVEQRLTGQPMADRLPALTTAQFDKMMQRYLDATLALGQVHAPANFTHYKLFDPAQVSQRTHGDWHQFLDRYLHHKLTAVRPYLSRDVIDFETKVNKLRSILAQPYPGDHRLIHGDFCPPNLLLDSDNRVTALLDFGLLTMYGDPLFDLATGWVFFDMYDELRAQVRQRYLALLLAQLGASRRGRLYCYVLYYSLVGANAYSSTCQDGHYQWCVDNLNRPDYWRGLE
jgi:aminoglycoside phosphotransferase (APT) family kinase protein